MSERGSSPVLTADDLYPDALPALGILRTEGYRLGLAANQPAAAARVLRALDVHLDLVATSEDWGIQKPDPRFFARIASELRLEPARIAYVGDRLDNDIRPAAAAGMLAVFIRRGPWGWIGAGRSDPPEAAIVIESLEGLPGAIRRARSSWRG